MKRLALLALLLLLAAPASADVVGWGYDYSGQLGNGYRSGPQGLTTAKLPCPAKEVAASVAWSLALCQDGTVYGFGSNQLSQLGLGKPSTGPSIPTRIPSLKDVRQVAASGSHAMVLLPSGEVLVWGSNLYGEAGNGTSTKGIEGHGLLVPQLVPGLKGVCQIAAGGPDDVALSCDGTVKAWGYNDQSQLGPLPREILTPRLIPGLSGVRSVAVGAFPSAGGHILAVLNDGTVKALGRNDQGQLGDGTTKTSSVPVAVKGLNEVVSVSASVDASLALRSDGTVFSFGSNRFGELGVGAGPEGCGKFPCSRFPVPVGLRNVTAISAGFRFSVAVANGKPFAWGWNLRGTADLSGLQRNSPVPVAEASEATSVSAGWYHTLAIVKGAGPPPNLEVTPGPGSLTVRWRSGPESKPWNVSYRPITRPASPWSLAAHPAASARSWTITGLAAVPTQVRVQAQHFGPEVVVSTPLPAL